MIHTEEFNEQQNRIDNVFAGIIRITSNMQSDAKDAIHRYATPYQVKTTILRDIKLLEQKLDELK